MSAAFIIGCGVAGVAVGAILPVDAALATRRISRSTALTYGPFLVAGALLVLFAAPDGRPFG